MDVVNQLESEVRSYCRTWPATFDRAVGHHIYDVDGRQYLDFFAGAGALNYGHNNPAMKEKLLEYLSKDGIVHSLDMVTVAKEAFLEKFNETILKPRELEYKMQFPGPTGTNAVEAAMKLARKVTGREEIVSFTNAFHGMTLGSLSITGNSSKRNGAGMAVRGGQTMPYDGYMGDDVDTVEYLQSFLENSSSGIDAPAAIIFETVQAEGGLATASNGWMRRIEALCREYGALLIVDDIQAGCGRTGTFFSFETAGIKPDIVLLSKSLSGYGLPVSLVLLKPELDIWEPGEHNGTFRGHNPAFVTATEALNYWKTPVFYGALKAKSARINEALSEIVDTHPEVTEVRGRGMIQGIVMDPKLCADVQAEAFRRGLIIETSGAESEVLKLLPPLTIDDLGLEEGLSIIKNSVNAVSESTLTTATG